MTGPEPLVSVVVPAFDAAATLDATLTSASGQTWPRIEIVVVDDGSRDDTAAIAQAAMRRDPRIRLIWQRNAGVAAARNAGIAASRGDWIAPLDADDLWHPDKIDEQMHAAARMPDALMVYCWSRRIDAAGRVLADQGRPRLEGRVLEQLIAFNFLNNASAAIMRRDAIEAVGGFDESFHRDGVTGAEDLALYLAVAARGPVAVAAGFLVGYRAGAGTMSTRAQRMRASVERALSSVEPRHPAPRLFRMGRTFHDLYAASIALNAGDGAAFVRFVMRALARMPLLTTAFLCAAASWRVAERRAARRGLRRFDTLSPLEASYRQPLMETFAARRIAMAASRAHERF